MTTTVPRPGQIGPLFATTSTVGEASVLNHLQTYVIVYLFIFFVMGGYLPTPSTRVSSLAASASSSDTVLGQLFQAFSWFLASLLMLRFFRQILEVGKRMKALVALSLLAVASTAWSQDPSNTVRRGVFLTLGTAFAFYLMRRFAVERLAQIVVLTGVVAGLVGIMVSIALPSYGRDLFNGGAWQGIFRSKNGCAQIMLFFFSAAVCFRFRSRAMETLRMALFPITGLLIVMSKAATGYMLAPGLALLVLFLSGLRRYERRNVVFVIVAVITLLICGSIAMPYIMPIALGILGKDPQMSGRLPLWTAVVASALKHPLLGYGYSAFWTGLRGESLNIFMTTHFEIYQAQNGVLELWLELGLVGVGLFFLTLIRAIKDGFVCLQQGYSPITNWFISLIALTVVYNIDETFLASAHSLPWLLYMVACVGLADRARQLRSKVIRFPYNASSLKHSDTHVRINAEPSAV
jgi:exopolysaccharide production protein ExoQ